MKSLLLLTILFILSSCSKDDFALSGEALKGDQITFGARSQKPKKGNFQGHLSGDLTDATGQVSFRFDRDNTVLYYKLIVANIDDIFAAHLHHTHMGGENHPVLTLFQEIVSGSTNGVLSEGTLTDDDINCTCPHPAHHTLAALRQHMEDGETSVIVHSQNFPEGEISGIIR